MVSFTLSRYERAELKPSGGASGHDAAGSQARRFHHDRHRLQWLHPLAMRLRWVVAGGELVVM